MTTVLNYFFKVWTTRKNGEFIFFSHGHYEIEHYSEEDIIYKIQLKYTIWLNIQYIISSIIYVCNSIVKWCKSWKIRISKFSDMDLDEKCFKYSSSHPFLTEETFVNSLRC